MWGPKVLRLIPKLRKSWGGRPLGSWALCWLSLINESCQEVWRAMASNGSAIVSSEHFVIGISFVPLGCKSCKWSTSALWSFNLLWSLSKGEKEKLLGKLTWPSQVALVVQNLPSNAGKQRGGFPGSGRSPGGGNGNPLQYSYLENPMDREAWRATVHGVPKNWTRLKQLST